MTVPGSRHYVLIGVRNTGISDTKDTGWGRPSGSGDGTPRDGRGGHDSPRPGPKFWVLHGERSIPWNTFNNLRSRTKEWIFYPTTIVVGGVLTDVSNLYISLYNSRVSSRTESSPLITILCSLGKYPGIHFGTFGLNIDPSTITKTIRTVGTWYSCE